MRLPSSLKYPENTSKLNEVGVTAVLSSVAAPGNLNEFPTLYVVNHVSGFLIILRTSAFVGRATPVLSVVVVTCDIRPFQYLSASGVFATSKFAARIGPTVPVTTTLADGTCVNVSVL